VQKVGSSGPDFGTKFGPKNRNQKHGFWTAFFWISGLHFPALGAVPVRDWHGSRSSNLDQHGWEQRAVPCGWSPGQSNAREVRRVTVTDEGESHSCKGTKAPNIDGCRHHRSRCAAHSSADIGAPNDRGEEEMGSVVRQPRSLSSPFPQILLVGGGVGERGGHVVVGHECASDIGPSWVCQASCIGVGRGCGAPECQGVESHQTLWVVCSDTTRETYLVVATAWCFRVRAFQKKAVRIAGPNSDRGSFRRVLICGMGGWPARHDQRSHHLQADWGPVQQVRHGLRHWRGPRQSSGICNSAWWRGWPNTALWECSERVFGQEQQRD